METGATAITTSLACLIAVGTAFGQEQEADDGPAQNREEEGPETSPAALTPVDGRDLSAEAAALEIAGFRNLGVVHITSEPPGAEVTLSADNRCYTPCRLTLPPGQYRLVFQHPEGTAVETVAEVTTEESLRVHGVLGSRTPPEIIVPLYFVGAIFAAGGISSLVLNRDDGPRPVDESEGDADSRRFHRNLGAASVAVGLPLLVLATYLLAAGRPGKVTSSTGPAGRELGLVPVLDESGGVAGAGLAGTF
jgi:hypothetical protein